MKHLPQAFLEKLPEIYSSELVESIVKSLSHPRTPSIRVNTLKTTKNSVEQSLESLDVSYSPVPWFQDAFVLNSDDKQLFTSSPLVQNGDVYIQSLSSMLAALVLEPAENDFILDLAAAPGSKTTLIASLMKNSGTIVANDVSPKRLHKLKENLELQGVINTQILHIPGERMYRKYPELFDKALIDVPCSMEGRFDASDETTYKDWTPKKGKILSSKQKHMLRSGISSVKVGGTIVYTTCTLSVEENEKVIDWVLKKEGDAIELEELSLPEGIAIPGLVQYKGKNFHPHMIRTKRILPSDEMEGFFIARFRKKRSTLSSS